MYEYNEWYDNCVYVYRYNEWFKILSKFSTEVLSIYIHTYTLLLFSNMSPRSWYLQVHNKLWLDNAISVGLI